MLTLWSADPLGLALTPLLAFGYALLLILRRSRGVAVSDGRWPLWRTAAFGSGCLLLAWILAGWPQAARSDVQWLDGLSLGLLAAVVPFAMALGDPVRLLEQARGRPVAWIRGRAARIILFPLVGGVINASVLIVACTTGWYGATRQQAGPWALLRLATLVSGALVCLPLLTEDLVPTWCTPGIKTLLAFLDGFVDAFPGIAFAVTVDWTTGLTLLAVTEAVGLPMVLAVLVGWVRSDESEAAALDARLDEQQAGAAGGADGAQDAPWWLSDPRVAERFRRPGPP